jgi:DNA-binding transcriptional MocR family regulator
MINNGHLPLIADQPCLEPSTQFSSTPEPSALSPEQIEEGVRRLAEAVKEARR